MAGIYDRFAALGDRLINKFDMGGTHVSLTFVTDNPDPLEMPDVTNIAERIPAVVFGVTGEMVARDPDLLVSDLRVIVSASEAPCMKVGDIIKIDGVDKSILRINPVPAAGVVSIYKLIVR